MKTNEYILMFLVIFVSCKSTNNNCYFKLLNGEIINDRKLELYSHPKSNILFFQYEGFKYLQKEGDFGYPILMPESVDNDYCSSILSNQRVVSLSKDRITKIRYYTVLSSDSALDSILTKVSKKYGKFKIDENKYFIFNDSSAKCRVNSLSGNKVAIIELFPSCE